MKKVLVFGTFDIIHPGHQWFLRNASRLGDTLIAVVSRDKFVQEWKGKETVRNEEARINALVESGLVNQAILADPEIRTYNVVKDIQPDIICLGHDQKALLEDLNSWISRTGDANPEIHVLPPWRRLFYSSSRRNKSLQGAGVKVSSTEWVLTSLLIAAMIVFGFSWVSGKRLSSAASPSTLSFIRFTITMLCFLPLILWKDKKPKISNKLLSGWYWTGAAALSISAYNLLFFMGLKSGLAGKGGLIVTTLNPLFTFLIVSITGKSKFGKTAYIGIALGVTGGILLIEPWSFSLKELTDSGSLAFLFAALAWSLLTIFSRKAQSILDFRVFNLRLYSIAALLMLPFAYIETKGKIPTGLNLSFWIDMVLISAVVGAFGTGVYFIASSRLGAAKASAFTYLVPVFAITFTSILLKEKPQALMITGGILAVSAVIAINWRKKTE